MYRICAFLIKFLLLISLCISLIACAKITQDNFTKVQTGMSMQEVIAILGEPSDSKSIDIAGLSLTAAVWKNQDAEIDIQFVNDRVEIKSFSKPEINQSNLNGSSTQT